MIDCPICASGNIEHRDAHPLTMTNDEAQDWLLGLLNATSPPRDAARFGAAIRAIRAKAIADAKEWYGLDAAPPSSDAGSPIDGRRFRLAVDAAIENVAHGRPGAAIAGLRAVREADAAANPDLYEWTKPGLPPRFREPRLAATEGRLR